MTSNNQNESIIMLASYQVDAANMDSFLEILKESEALYRTYEVITSAPVIRLQSIKNPEFIVELIEWRSREHLNAVMENDEIMAKWGQIKDEWKNGDIGFNNVPEANIPWATLRPIK